MYVKTQPGVYRLAVRVAFVSTPTGRFALLDCGETIQRKLTGETSRRLEAILERDAVDLDLGGLPVTEGKRKEVA